MANVFLKIRDRGEDRFFAELHDLPDISVRGMRAAWFAVGQDWKRTLQREILRRPKSGLPYRVNGRVHIASAPGETVADRTGDTRRSATYQTRGFSQLDVGFGLGKGASDYVGYDEFGTRFMEERRSVRNAMLAIEGAVQQHFNEGLARGLARSRRGL